MFCALLFFVLFVFVFITFSSIPVLAAPCVVEDDTVLGGIDGMNLEIHNVVVGSTVYKLPEHISSHSRCANPSARMFRHRPEAALARI